MDYKDIEKLIDKLDKSSLSHFEYEKDNFKLVIKKEAAVQNTLAPQPKIMPAETPDVEIKTKETKFDDDENIILVKSPIVGTFYASSSPDIPAFVTAGSKVKKGDTLCIIEAMKLMNEIEAEADGEILEVLCENESMVEYGEVIFKIKKEK
ncbi:MAG: acetyl-CoA carboxylase biotin carboxyl carrier protein [Bacillota bacterium]|nr:acetyl-CoA carboxylase biotin carboxyl carrier protein [Bacillota bacterium]